MKSALFITVRKDSSRLPNKAIRKILGCQVLELIIKRAKLATKFNEVIVCTTKREIDDEIVQIAEKNNALVFRGDLNDKLMRWLGAAEKYKIDYIVTFDGDDLFCEPALLDMGLEQLISHKLDFIEAPKGLICGAFTYAFTRKALKTVCDIKASTDTEMMWTYFKDTGIFKIGVLDNVEDIFFRDDIRCTLDYPEDLEFFTKILEYFQCKNNDISLKDIVEYINKNPDIAKINIHRQQEFLDNQRKKTHLVLKGDIDNE